MTCFGVYSVKAKNDWSDGVGFPKVFSRARHEAPGQHISGMTL